MTTGVLDLPSLRPLPNTGRDYISFSAIRLYQTCPLKFFYRYIMGLPEETVSSSLVFGSSVHRAFEFHFRELLAGNPPPHIQDPVTVAEHNASGKGERRAVASPITDRSVVKDKVADGDKVAIVSLE